MNYLVIKQTPNGLFLIKNGSSIFIEKVSENYNAILELADKYNETKNVDDREKIFDQIINLSISKEVQELLNSDEFELDQNGSLYLKGIKEPIPDQLADMIKDGLKEKVDISTYKNFWINLALNPDVNVRSQLFGFLEHNGHPLTKHGYFLAYKAVNVKTKYDETTGEPLPPKIYDAETGEKIITQDLVFTSIHKGKYGSIIKVGEPVTMPREECDSDPMVTCSSGLHVGSMEYVAQFGYSDSVILECLINPRHVIAVPIDYNNTKMRVCEYYPFAISNGINKNIYLESDYIAYDKEQLKKEIEEFEDKKNKLLERLEQELELRKKLAGGIL
jgi:hypothetical protein